MNKTGIDNPVEFQDYTDYIDTSDVMLSHYRQQPANGLDKHIFAIEEWLNQQVEDIEDNKPLVIQGQGGIGKKMLISKWYEYHESLKQDKKKDLVLLHFATTGGNNSNYFYALYRILVRLRETLNIGQKVQLHAEKLRKYFSYWLQVSNDTIDKQVINNPDVIYQKIIIVFEGIDYFVDRETNKQGNIAFWLPKYFPKNIKVIVTADHESETVKYFERLKCQWLKLPVDTSIVKNLVQEHAAKKVCASDKVKQKILELVEERQAKQKDQKLTLYIRALLSCFLPENMEGWKKGDAPYDILVNATEQLDFAKLAGLSNVENLMEYILDFWGRKLIKNEDKFKEILALLLLTQKGLNKSEIMLISKATADELKLMMSVFGNFMISYGNLFMIKNDCFRRCVQKKYKIKVQDMHERIAEALKKTPNSLRKLEEETYQLYSARCYFKLKEIISDVENFLLLFNSYNKYDLCRYWQKLEEKSFDPVIEYNKAVESFEMHYHPSSENLFRITVQISRFLKEFSDFETYYTPKFRHPEIIGSLWELKSIGLLGEFLNLGLVDGAAQAAEEALEEDVDSAKVIAQLVERLDKGLPSKKEILKLEETDKPRPRDQPKQPRKQPLQQYNVEVKSNQINFFEHYYRQIQAFLRKVNLDNWPLTGKSEPETTLAIVEKVKSDQMEGNMVEEIRDSEYEPGTQKVHNGEDTGREVDEMRLQTLFRESVVEEFELVQAPPTNYYYKRWIWMQFPWVCMTMKCNYSKTIMKCFTSPTEYMTVAEEKQFTIQSLKIALEAKKKKQSVLEQKKEDGDRTMKSFLGPLTVARFNSSRGDESSMIAGSRRKMEEIAYLTNSFLNLQTLTKEIETMNLTRQGSVKALANREENIPNNTMFLTQGAMQSSASEYTYKPRKRPTMHDETTSQLNNSKMKQGLLPRIKQSMNNEMQRELETLEKNNSTMRKDLDSLTFLNKTLAKKLKELKIIEFNNQSQVKNVKKVEETKAKIQALQAKIVKIKHQYVESLLQQRRLSILIKICKHNKTQNEEAIPSLTFECSNFKKMIKWEKEAIDQLNRETEEIRKISNKFMVNVCDRIENEVHLNEEIKSTIKNREEFETEVEKYDSMIIEEVAEQRRKINEEVARGLSKKESKENNEKATKDTGASNPNYEQLYSDIAKYLGVQTEEEILNHPRYLQFLNGLYKQREFQATIQERSLKLEQLERRYREEMRDYSSLSKVDSEETPNDDKPVPLNREEIAYNMERQVHDRQRVYSKILETKLACLGMVNTWTNRVGLGEVKELGITSQFVGKIKDLIAGRV